MGAPQSNGISSGWGNLVIVSSDIDPDWGEVDALELYYDKFGVYPEEGKKYFIEMYWIDTETGFTGKRVRVGAICRNQSAVKEEGFIERNIVTEEMLVLPQNAEKLDYKVEGVNAGAMIWANIEFEVGGITSGLDGGVKDWNVSIPGGSYYMMGRGKSRSEEAVSVQVKTAYRDSIVFVDKYIEKEVEVPAELSGWQKLKLNVGTATLLAIAIIFIYLCAKVYTQTLNH